MQDKCNAKREIWRMGSKQAYLFTDCSPNLFKNGQSMCYYGQLVEQDLSEEANRKFDAVNQ